MSGTFPTFDYENNSTVSGANAQPSFTTFFGSGSAIGSQSAVYNGLGTVPPSTDSTNSSLIVTGGASTAIPNGYAAAYDLSSQDTVTGGVSGLSVYLQNDSTYIGGSGADTVYAGGADRVWGGSAPTSVFGGADGTTVQGGAGSLQFVGGLGAVSVSGGAGNTTLWGGNGSAASVLTGGSGNNTLIGGSGSGPTTLTGGGGTVMFADGNSPTLFQQTAFSQGNLLINGTTGAGQELVVGARAGAVNETVALNNNADTVLSGAGQMNVLGGQGPDLYGIFQGDGSITNIYGFKAIDQVAFVGETVAKEQVVHGSDQIIGSGGDTVNLIGVDHTVYS